MNKMKLAKSAAVMSQIFDRMSAVATMVAALTLIFSAACWLRKIKP
jgi:hypothetical protein